MLKRQRQTMLLVRFGLAISVCLNVVLFKWRLLTVFIELPAEVDSLLPPVTSWSVATGVLECMAAILMVTASMKGTGRTSFIVTRLLKYYFLMQLLVSVLALMADGMASVFAISDICRFLVLISLLVFIDFDQDLRLTRDRAREARRVAGRSRLQKVVYTLERRELS
jgi:hypothetical protein